MNLEDKNLIIELAKRLTIYQPEISVLKEELLDQYILPVKAIDSCLKNKLINKKLLLPELRKDGNETIAIASDYGGESCDSAYYTYSFLVFGWNHSWGLSEWMEEVRDKYDLKEKEISFKDLKYGPINRCLSDYLWALDASVVGLLETVIIDKEIKSVFGEKLPEYVLNEVTDAGFGEWKPKVIEKVMRVAHIAAYLVALLSQDGQKIYWMTDNDSIVSNTNKSSDFFKLFQSVLTLYTENQFLHIGYSLPFEKRSMRQLDLLSCPDIVAGAVEHFLTKYKRNNPILKDGVEKILAWLGRDGPLLKRHTVLIKRVNNDDLEIGEIKFNLNNADNNKNKILIPIPVRYKV